jgi:hypothetical protein
MSVTAEQVAAAAQSGGLYWWLTPVAAIYTTADDTAKNSVDTYLLRASDAWLAQWHGDWEKAANQINAAITTTKGG